jgi:hypothetical protein
MAVFLGNAGNVRLRRGISLSYGVLEDVIKPDDINTFLNRLSFSSALDNLLTGDRVDITTTDSRGLICFDPTAWESGVVEPTISAYVNVNGAGGLRFFNSFENAVNNNRSAELAVYAFTGADIPIQCTVRDTTFNVLGNVTSYQLNTDRETLDVTSLSDKFKRQYAAGLISGSGSIDCLFDYSTTGVKEAPVLMLQLIQRIDIGSEFDLVLYLTDRSLDASGTSVYYELDAVVTRAGVTVDTEGAITCTVDFVSTGEIRLLIGEPAGYVLKEDDDRIQLQQSLDFLLQEADD